MSTRTIIEINHDHLGRRQLDELIELFNSLSGTTVPTLLAQNEDKPFQWSTGIRVVMQRHHSTDVTVKSKYQEIKL